MDSRFSDKVRDPQARLAAVMAAHGHPLEAEWPEHVARAGAWPTPPL